MKYYLIYQLRNVSFITQSCLVEIVNAILYELKPKIRNYHPIHD